MCVLPKAHLTQVQYSYLNWTKELSAFLSFLPDTIIAFDASLIIAWPYDDSRNIRNGRRILGRSLPSLPKERNVYFNRWIHHLNDENYW